MDKNKPKNLNQLLNEAQNYIKEERFYKVFEILENIVEKESSPEFLERTKELLQIAYQAQIKMNLNNAREHISKYLLSFAKNSLDSVEEYSKKSGIVVSEVQELREKIDYLSTPPLRISRIEEEIKESEKTPIGERDYTVWLMDLKHLKKETQSEELTKKINELEKVVLEGCVKKDFWWIREEISEMKKFIRKKIKKKTKEFYHSHDDNWIELTENYLKKLGREEDKKFQELRKEFGKIIPFVKIQDAKIYINQKSFSSASWCLNSAERYSQKYNVQIPSDEIAKLRKSIEGKVDVDEDYTCGDCGVKVGEKHDYGCDIERCPICGGQLISCNCFEEMFGEEDIERNRKKFLKKLEKVGRIPYSEDNRW